MSKKRGNFELSQMVFSQTPGRPGEVNFVWAGFLLQITSQMAECSKNLIGEMVMSGAGDLFYRDLMWIDELCDLIR